ncbi:entericidin [Acetobacteraceae bacterium KSS8]|uniref:Entericidin n=1 Tax=Endosaccharibacter trunci TaxID=2812733 RepID=A0ABT1W7J1_9PROT|nr:entericidin [Acetobacteraceae bacterium KSS8]
MFNASCRVLATVGLLAAATVGLSACNTVSGMGQDASALGHDVSRGATATQSAVTSNTGLATH